MCVSFDIELTEMLGLQEGEWSQTENDGDRSVLKGQLVQRRKKKIAMENLGKTSGGTGAEQGSSAVFECSMARSGQESKVMISTAFSMLSLFKISSRLNDEKKEIIQSIGFGSLISLPEFKLFPRQIVLWLLSNLDTLNGAIKLRDGDLIPFSSRDVDIVLGISSRGKCVIGEDDTSLATPYRKKSLLLLRSGEEPTIRNLESIILKDYGRGMSAKEKEAFKLAFVLYVEAVFLGAKGRNPKVNSELLKKFCDISAITQLDWSDYVVRCLKDSARKVQLSLLNGNRNITIEGCLYFLLVSYNDFFVDFIIWQEQRILQ
jgi:hypothetical protein